MGKQIYVGKYKLEHLLEASKCVSKNEAQTNYKSVMFDKNQNVYGTDSARLYFNSIDKNTNYDKPQFSVTPNFFKHLISDEVDLYFTSTYVGTILDDNTMIYSRLSSSNYPDLKPIIETPLNKKVTFKCNDDLNILTTKHVVIHNVYNQILFRFKDDVNSFVCTFESNGDDFYGKYDFSFLKDFIKLNDEENVIEANDNGAINLNGNLIVLPLREV